MATANRYPQSRNMMPAGMPRLGSDDNDRWKASAAPQIKVSSKRPWCGALSRVQPRSAASTYKTSHCAVLLFFFAAPPQCQSAQNFGDADGHHPLAGEPASSPLISNANQLEAVNRPKSFELWLQESFVDFAGLSSDGGRELRPTARQGTHAFGNFQCP